MSHRSIINSQLTQGAEIATISSNTITDFVFELSGFENGNVFSWGSTDYTDGNYILSFAESPDGNFANSTPIPSNRIIIPQVVRPNLDPFSVDGSTQGIRMGGGLMRQLEIRGIETPFTHAVITSTGVTVGATFFLAWMGMSEISPVIRNQIP